VPASFGKKTGEVSYNFLQVFRRYTEPLPALMFTQYTTQRLNTGIFPGRKL
jgi:hypothetical protein